MGVTQRGYFTVNPKKLKGRGRQSLKIEAKNFSTGTARIEYMTDKGVHKVEWEGKLATQMYPMTLWRVVY